MSTRIISNLKYPPIYYTESLPSDFIFAGDGGFWHDLGDWDNMYLDRAMTTKVTAAGQAVAAVRDKGVNGIHVFQDTAGRRPISWQSGSVRGLDFTAANLCCLKSDIGGIALSNNHGWAIFETDLANNFQRVWATSGNATTDGVGPSAMVLSSGDATTFADLRALNLTMQVAAPGAGNSPRALYEYEVTFPLSKMWVNGTLTQQDATATGPLQAKSTNRVVIGALSQNGDASAAAPGAFDGRIFQVLHLGTIPSLADQTKIETWLDTYRW